MGRRVLVCAVLVGCGRIGFDPTSAGGGGGDAGDAAVDALAPCTQWSPFGAPVHVMELGAPSTDDWGPALSADGLSIYFYSGRPGMGSFDIWTSTRPSVGAQWTVPVAVTAVNSAFEERVPWISSDGLTLGFATDRPGGLGMLDMWWSTRPDPQSAFGPPSPIPNVNSSETELGGYLSADGLRLYMSVTTMNTGLDIVVAERPTLTAPFGPPTTIGQLDSAMNERDIAVSADELEAFIVTNRTGAQGDDVYRATRADRTSAWSAPQRVTELDTPMDDTGPELSRDGTTLFYNYNAVSAGGDSEIWTATRTCLAR